MNNKSGGSKIIYAITVIILCVILWFVYRYYQENNFNDFVRSEGKLYTSEFKRDNKVKYSKQSSYRIKSEEYNDAMFYETIKVEKNQPYKVTCMVKTKNVVPEEEQSSIGAQISIEGSTERSIAIQGTTEWQKIEFIFNSEDRDTVNLGFRLGGNAGQAKGTAWFSDFTLEEGIAENDNNWKFACFILESTDVDLNGKNIRLIINLSYAVEVAYIGSFALYSEAQNLGVLYIFLVAIVTGILTSVPMVKNKVEYLSNKIEIKK